jgi:hypothetical protein
MTGERVSVMEGKLPIIIVAPHGYNRDDENTAVLAEEIASCISCYAVINRGWERDDCVDAFNDKADCNNVEHCHQDVVKEEFLDPILRFRNRIRKKHPIGYMFMIHGMSDKHRKLANDPQLEIVLGYGAGTPDSYTCELWRKNVFGQLLTESGMTVYEGKKGGAMSGWARQNMNQLFRKWYADPTMQSMQIEIIHELRVDRDAARLTGNYLADAMKEMLGRTKFSGTANAKRY